MEHYEAAILLSPNLTDKEVEGFVQEAKEMLVRFGAADLGEPKIDRRALAYPVRRHNEAYYVFLGFFGPPALPEQVRVELRHREELLRLAFIRKPPAPVEQETPEVPDLPATETDTGPDAEVEDD